MKCLEIVILQAQIRPLYEVYEDKSRFYTTVKSLCGFQVVEPCCADNHNLCLIDTEWFEILPVLCAMSIRPLDLLPPDIG
jgi:hypothetical protein